MELKKSIVASSTPPVNKEVIWLDTKTRTLRIYRSTLWQPLLGEAQSINIEELNKAMESVMAAASRMDALEDKTQKALILGQNTSDLIGQPSSEGKVNTPIYDVAGKPVSIEQLEENTVYYLDTKGKTQATEGVDYILPTEASGLYALLRDVNVVQLPEMEFELWESL